MIVWRTIACSRCWGIRAASSSLRPASPNKDELYPQKKPNKTTEFFMPSTTNADPLTSIIQLNEKARQAAKSREWSQMEPNGLIKAYLQLSKHRLTFLITSTTVCGYFIAPVPIDLTALGACAVGTSLLSSASNACNHILEAPYDAQMRRTQKRVLVVHRITPLHAFGFATTSAAVGLGVLCLGCNSLTAALGLLNLFLYVAVYTPMKRYHIGCTWVGAVVGGIPPLMGYATATGRLDAASLVLAAILFSWQFPHFNALSWNLRGDYSRAGYRVMCVTNEELCRRTTLRHAVALLGLCSVAAPLSNLTNIVFAIDSIPFNLAFICLSYAFYREPNEDTAKKLFRYSLLYLPIIMLLAVISNAGQYWMDKKKQLSTTT